LVEKLTELRERVYSYFLVYDKGQNSEKANGSDV
jgi:hypothetical protein